eukprot:TRINITY_DN22807_c0_g1_i2.p1 TRINITY_DN22807_c0_g1~~TRINITY_DN22807_c0_g1_i2.p1  ORF type:complete len:486 (+),score=157.04 TRINITY_DN22807_c0_g1_i2:53-1459(+)
MRRPGNEGRRGWWRDAVLCCLLIGCYFAAVSRRSVPQVAPPVNDVLLTWAREQRGPRTVPSEVRFLTFEPWNGGWNNRRMSLEIAFALARATNRTLVLPPRLKQMNQVRGESGYEDFFSVQRIAEHVPVMTWRDFAPLLEVMTPSPGAVQQSPTVCRQYKYRQAKAFCEACKLLRSKAKAFDFGGIDGSTLGVVVPVPLLSTEHSNVDQDDFAAFRGPRRLDRGAKLAEADSAETVLHFPQNLFGLFYAVVYHNRRKERLALRRAARDALRLRLTVTAPAAAVADQLRRMGGGHYVAVHYRWGDFKGQFDHALVHPVQMARSLRVHLYEGAPVYVASDETDEEVWDVIRRELAGFRVLRLGDALRMLGDSSPPQHMHGVVEMLICSGADVFVGTKFSTFSAYITRLRGYSAVRNKELYFTDTNYTRHESLRDEERKPYSWSGEGANRLGDYRGYRPYWIREYPEAWEL